MKCIGYLIFFVLLSTPTFVSAHHSTSTNRPSAKVAQSSNTQDSRLSLVYQLSYFGSTLEGDKEYSRSGLGSLLHNRLSLDGIFLLKTGTFFEASVPFSTIHVCPEDGSNLSLVGISDITLGIGQRFNVDLENNQQLSFVPHLGISLATGAYNPDSLLSKTDISAGTNGQIDVTTFNVNTSLGSGAYNARLGAEFGYRINNRIETAFVQSLSIPLTRTSDDISWGLDSSSAIRFRWDVFTKRLALTTSLNYELHTVDEVPDLESTNTYNNVGGKDQFSIGLGAIISLSRFDCRVGLNLPIYQNVGGIQLVETVNGQLECGLAL